MKALGLAERAPQTRMQLTVMSRREKTIWPARAVFVCPVWSRPGPYLEQNSWFPSFVRLQPEQVAVQTGVIDYGYPQQEALG